VFRYLSYVLVGSMAGVLAVMALGILGSGLSERLGGGPGVALVALDTTMAEAASLVRVGAGLFDPDLDRPIPGVMVFARYPDGQTVPLWAPRSGVCFGGRRGRLPRGPHPYEVAFPDTGPRAGVQSRGTVWVEPGGADVVWVDAAAVVGVGPGTDAAPAAGQAGRQALEALAAGRVLVYLVAAELRDYAPARRHVAESGCPAGPVVWLPPSGERSVLAALRQAWPHVAAALVCTPALAEAAAVVKVKAIRVPRADGAAEEPGEAARAWPDVIRTLGPAGGGAAAPRER